MVTTDEVIDTRRRILDVAARLFREQGYAGVSLRAIAREADMKAGSFYYHFASKEDLVVDVLNEGIRAVRDSVERAMQSLGPDADGSTILRTAVHAHLTSLLRLSDYTSANVRVFGQAPEGVRVKALATRRGYETFWDDLLGLAQRRGGLRGDADLRVARLVIFGALNASLEWFRPDRGSIEQLADSYADLLWRGLRPEALKS
ncbi:MAG: TetR/AcrR family transcriptional regulator [Reyranella sp.]|nr:TetR/AcrR family transcriptional regulator [Reyranella sp.]MDP3159609.1 TetR/AcrR family transcriptional regulator [Reyranella sp.]